MKDDTNSNDYCSDIYPGSRDYVIDKPPVEIPDAVIEETPAPSVLDRVLDLFD